jgi:hypothetical protein
MSENQSKDDVMPDELMQRFRGRSLKSMLIFTLIIHLGFILATSLPGIVSGILADDTSEMTAEERSELAAKEASAAFLEIAQRHNITAQELTNRFAGKAPARATAEPSPAPLETEAPAEKSAIEQELETTAEGPAVPPIPEAEEEDLFK